MGAFDARDPLEPASETDEDAGWIEYADLGGDSGISHYRVADGAIDVRFKRGSEYRYRARDVMPGTIEVMRWLAESGDDLNRFLNERAWAAGVRIGGVAGRRALP